MYGDLPPSPGTLCAEGGPTMGPGTTMRRRVTNHGTRGALCAEGCLTMGAGGALCAEGCLTMGAGGVLCATGPTNHGSRRCTMRNRTFLPMGAGGVLCATGLSHPEREVYAQSCPCSLPWVRGRHVHSVTPGSREA